MKKAISNFMKEEIKIERRGCYVFLGLILLMLLIIYETNSNDRYIYGINNENRITDKCYKKADGLYCVDEIKVDWYYKAKK